MRYIDHTNCKTAFEKGEDHASVQPKREGISGAITTSTSPYVASSISNRERNYALM